MSTLSTFDKAVNLVIEQEGGYVNDPNDPGGETNFGISKRVYPKLDILMLTVEQAKAIYKRDYWDMVKCDQLPSGIALMTFDAAVNMGTYAAIKHLQAALGTNVDGVLGPNTLTLANKLGNQLLPALAARRMVAYGNMAQFGRYGLGWSNRLMKVFKSALEET